ncbi:MAG TPA: carboxynorspermidine decarboxylase [Bacteroidales bacterium]|nr:carboxynorspermidine decarboxylase [Bacteroidales bacterium]
MPIDYYKLPSPCFVIEEKRLRKNLELIKNIGQEAGVEFILAFKSFAMWGVFPIMREYIRGAASSSLSEVRLCHEEMGSKAHTYSPVYKEEEIAAILEMSSHITFNSIAQYKKYHEIVKKAANASPGLRINPEYSEIAHGLYNPCLPGSRFGVTAEQLSKGLPEDIEGLHFHLLFEADSFIFENTLKVVEEKFGHLFSTIRWINMGGGHLVTQKDYDTAHLVGILREFRERHDVEVILEPGSAFAWETGELVSTVEDIVTNQGIKTAILDVSFTAHMPDCLEMPYKPTVIGAVEPAPGLPTYRLGGSSCLSGDFIGDWSFHRELKPGDRIVFWDMMHYTLVKTTTFNGVRHPSIVLWDTDNTARVIRRFGYEDYKNRLS